MRLACAHAKLMLRTTATLQDAVVAVACVAASQAQMQSHSSLSSTSGAWSSLGLGSNNSASAQTQTFLHYDFPEQPDAAYLTLEMQVLTALHCSRDSLLAQMSEKSVNTNLRDMNTTKVFEENNDRTTAPFFEEHKKLTKINESYRDSYSPFSKEASAKVSVLPPPARPGFISRQDLEDVETKSFFFSSMSRAPAVEEKGFYNKGEKIPCHPLFEIFTYYIQGVIRLTQDFRLGQLIAGL